MGWPTKEMEKEYHRKRYLAKKEEYKLRAKEWAKANPERRKEILAKNQAKSKVPRLVRQRLRVARQLEATPKWLSDTHLKEIATFYEVASWYEEPMHVDHIVPLRGKLVCGLHVPWNLQVITAEANMKKHNTFEVH